jgi:Tol biopolymer transport system component/DNA-binding winged helix-turn-helix (wHTH) protein
MAAYAFGPFVLDVSERRLLRDGQPLALTPKPFDLLCLLVERSGHLVSKDELLHAIWPGSFVEEANLNRCVWTLRKALGDTATASRYVETVPTRGYRFIAPVVPVVAGFAVGQSASLGRPNDGSMEAPPAIPARRMTASRRGAAMMIAAGCLVVVGGVYMLMRADWRIAKAALRAAAHRQVTFEGREEAPALSRDGRQLAYVSSTAEGRQIVVQDLDGGARRVVASVAEAGNLRWSPDSTQLLFFARDEGPGGIFIVPRLGGSVRQVVAGAFVACWSPDGRRLAVAQPRAGIVRLVDLAGRPVGQIPVEGARRWVSDLDWSTDTNRLLVVGNDLQGRYTVWTIGSDGSDQQTVTVEKSEIKSARWASGANAIYYSRRDGQTITLTRVPAAGTQHLPVPLLTGLESDGSFAVSADDERIVYARAPFYSNLYAVQVPTGPARGTPVARQLTHGTALVERPRVSPDGTQVLFNAGHGDVANLYRIPVAGGEPTAVTALKAFNIAGAWSSDGRTVAFGSTEGGVARVWLTNTTGGTAHAVSSGQFSDSFDVQWSPSQEILYQQAGNRNYYRLDVTTGRERLLMADASAGWIFSPVLSPDRTRVAFGWSRPSGFGLWIRNVADASERLIYGQSIPTVIGWSADGQRVYAYEGDRVAYRGLTTLLGETTTHVRVIEVSQSGKATTLVTLPFSEVGGIAMTPDGTQVICSVYSSRSDVWTVEGFDNGRH